MKQYARIFHYLRDSKGKVFLFFLFTFLSIIFSIVSIGMLMPFLQLIFTGTATLDTKSTLIRQINNFLNEFGGNDKVAVLGFICLLMISFIILKNLFFYLSYYVLNPLKNRIVNQLR